MKISEGLSKAELILDEIYKETDHWLCKAECNEILSAMIQIRNGQKIIYKHYGKPMYVTRAGEVAFTYNCQQVKAKIANMHKTNQYCEEPANHRVKDSCTRQICTTKYMSGFNIGCTNGSLSSQMGKLHQVNH